ncbi:MAG TPA: hypothetical protein VLA88_00930 [Candidatus Saccharimonadales bacterium]|nr:hypothetical protein [Candidatus Saccharimonadales bacterium]
MTREEQAAALAEGLFMSSVPTSQELSPRDARQAALRTLRKDGGPRHCAAEVAAEFGDSPETALPRMRWAREALGLAA